MAPWCRVLRITAQPMPTFRAFSMAFRIARTVTTGPGA